MPIERSYGNDGRRRSRGICTLLRRQLTAPYFWCPRVFVMLVERAALNAAGCVGRVR
jgi:hypothetical protein